MLKCSNKVNTNTFITVFDKFYLITLNSFYTGMLNLPSIIFYVQIILILLLLPQVFLFFLKSF